jgi:putative SOS response-associated peptidase YedK
MCGRFTISVEPGELAEVLGVEFIPDVRKRYNVAPTQTILAARMTDAGKREAVLFHWGLIPSWSKDSKIQYSTINAKSETAARMPAFRSAFKCRRCIIPADGFFEWEKRGKAKFPHSFHRKDRKAFVFAGLWERWEPESGDAIESCTVMTTEANSVVMPFHDRMPVILTGDSADRWLKPGDISPEVAEELLKPAPAAFLIDQEVSTIVNSPKTDSPQCIEPVAAS